MPSILPGACAFCTQEEIGPEQEYGLLVAHSGAVGPGLRTLSICHLLGHCGPMVAVYIPLQESR